MPIGSWELDVGSWMLGVGCRALDVFVSGGTGVAGSGKVQVSLPGRRSGIREFSPGEK